MEWIEVALKNPLENWPLWLVVLLALFQLSQMLIRFGLAMQANTSQDNNLQGRLIDEIAARRAAEEIAARRTADEIAARRITDENFRNRLADLLDEKVTRIDKTTIATHGKAEDIYKELTETRVAVKEMWRIMKEKGIA